MYHFSLGGTSCPSGGTSHSRYVNLFTRGIRSLIEYCSVSGNSQPSPSCSEATGRQSACRCYLERIYPDRPSSATVLQRLLTHLCVSKLHRIAITTDCLKPFKVFPPYHTHPFSNPPSLSVHGLLRLETDWEPFRIPNVVEVVLR